jgi:nitrite reductase (cytochrome c-552)
MPYRREGALKVTDHQVRSPLLNLNRACQTCHHWPEAELKGRVEAIQERHVALRDRALGAVVDLIGELKQAKAEGRGGEEVARAREMQRRAQFYVDFVEAENSTGFHAPQETARVLGEAIDYARQGQLALRGGGPPPTAPPPVASSSSAPPPASAPTPSGSAVRRDLRF